MTSNSDFKSNIKSDMEVPLQHGRTDGRTDLEQLAQLSQVTAVDAHAHIEGFTSVGEVIQAWAEAPQGRHEVIRTGQRTEIPTHVRSAVYLRDRGRCELCGWLPISGPWHLDHIKPWSAGGADTTDNLRVLCEKHNLERSNFHEMHERTRPPATWWCVNCYSRDDFHWDTITKNALPVCRLHGRPRDPIADWKGCPVTRGYHQTYEAMGEWPTWHTRRQVLDGTQVAYCAHCRKTSVTDVVL